MLGPGRMNEAVSTRHQLDVGHERPDTPRTASFVTAGSAVHEVPFQRLLAKPPDRSSTAMQNIDDGHESSLVALGPLATTDHAEPSKRSCSGVDVGLSGSGYWTLAPAARQEVAVAHSTT